MDQILIRFRLVGEEARALQELSAGKLRHPRDQVRYLLRCALWQKGYMRRDQNARTQAFQATPDALEETVDGNNQ